MSKIFICLLFLSKVSFAQFYDSEKAVPSYFDKFINKESIEWAAYINDTVRFNTINLSEILRTRFKANEIQVTESNSVAAYDPRKIFYVSKHDIKYQGANQVPRYDSLGNLITDIKENDDNPLPPIQFDSTVFNLLDIAQLFYIEKGIMKVFIPFVAPKNSIITSNGINLGQADYFVTAFNFDYRFTNSRKDKIINIGETNKLIMVDSIEKPYGSHILKQLYGRNMVESLWPYILSGELKIQSAENSNELSVKELDKIANRNEKIQVPVYDSLGNFLRNDSIFTNPISPAVFKQISLRQQWFYNQTKNLVYNKITELVFFQNRFDNAALENKLRPVFKIVFK